MKDTIVYTLDGIVYINLTNRCCNDCTFCLRKSGDSVKDNGSLWLKSEPSTDEVIAELDKQGGEWNTAVFCGYGESTYRLDVMKAVAAHLKSRGKTVRLNTNGLGNQINNRRIEDELTGLIDVVSISLNAPDEVKYNEVSRPVFGRESFGYLLQFASRCAAAGIETVLTVVDILPKDDIEKCRALADSIGARLRVRGYIANNEAYN